jgi:hypothetical protein
MAQKHDTHRFTRTEVAITVLFCLIDDAYTNLNPRGPRYDSVKRLSDSAKLFGVDLPHGERFVGVDSEGD